MGVRIVLDGPRPDGGRRAGRALAVAAALPLILVGVVALIGLVYLVAMQVTDSVTRSDQAKAALYTAWCAVAAFVGLWLGLQLLRGRRRLVLFLRRFGYADATQALSFAATNAIGGSWRLVTLDDDIVKGVGGSTAPRKASGFGTFFVLAAVGAFGWWFYEFGADLVLDDMLSSATSSGGDPVDGIGKALGAAFGLGIIVFILMWLVIALVGVSVPLLLFSYFKARRAERALTERIGSEREIPRPGVQDGQEGQQDPLAAPHRGDRGARRVAADRGRLRVRFGCGDHRRDDPVRCAALGDQHAAARAGPQVCAGRQARRVDEDAAERTHDHGLAVAQDIDGHEILAYRSDSQGLRRFAKALRGTIESRV